jgi:hypothetical protein
VQEAQCEQDDLLLHTEKYGFSAEPDEELVDNNNDEELVNDDDVLPPSTGPTAPSPSHKHNISVPTPGIRRSLCIQAKEKAAANLIVQGIVIKPHYLSDVDPFDKLLDNHDHIDDALSDPEVISIIQHHLMAIADATQKYPDDTDDLHVNALQSELVTPEELALSSFTCRKLTTLSTWSGPSGWLAAEKQQLDQFHNIEMFGPPVDPRKSATILRPQWNFRIKANGARRAQQCCDGSEPLCTTPLLWNRHFHFQSGAPHVAHIHRPLCSSRSSCLWW